MPDLQDNKVVIEALELVNRKIRTSKDKIPYPFDSSLYIKKIDNIYSLQNGAKSHPLTITLTCGIVSELEK